MFKTRRFAVAATAAVTALMGGLVATPAASAQERNVVLFGDSIMANPTYVIADLIQGPGKATKNAPTPAGRCPQGQSRVGASLARISGAKVEDFACTGAVAYAPIEPNKRLSKEVDLALAGKQLNAGTTNVFLQIGMNDSWKAPGIYSVQTENFVNEMKTQVGRIKAAAPNAKIAFVGYPSILGANNTACPVQLNNMPAPPISTISVRNSLNAAHDWQRQSAAATGTGWIDLEKDTAGHDMCAAKDQRWIAGIIDNSSDPYNITTHLTHKGNDGVAEILAKHL
ncbi:GDSL-type esterase/lipase family protein [Corynebacterium matruchotii]|uniref:GDSL-type esterase/lipase family protein n=1 Tax=Corynebacterium matruchotii TaxID=43768 RepID=UPI0028E8A2A6|nr:GDSL-type esterase/lipase family protein [Corynebacterium matruchotii]